MSALVIYPSMKSGLRRKAIRRRSANKTPARRLVGKGDETRQASMHCHAMVPPGADPAQLDYLLRESGGRRMQKQTLSSLGVDSWLQLIGFEHEIESMAWPHLIHFYALVLSCIRYSFHHFWIPTQRQRQLVVGPEWRWGCAKETLARGRGTVTAQRCRQLGNWCDGSRPESVAKGQM